MRAGRAGGAPREQQGCPALAAEASGSGAITQLCPQYYQPIQEVHTLLCNIRLSINEARKLFISGFNLKLNKTPC